MKFLIFCYGFVAATPLMNMLVMKNMLDGDNDLSLDDNVLMTMMMSPGLLGGNQNQADQMSTLLPLMLMDQSSDDNNLMLMMMIMQNGPNGMATNIDQMLPFLFMNDGTTDMKNLFLVTSMMQNNCEDTNAQLKMLLPLLLMTEAEVEVENEDNQGGRKKRANDEDTFPTEDIKDLSWFMSCKPESLSHKLWLCNCYKKTKDGKLICRQLAIGRKRRETTKVADENKSDSNTLKTLLLLQTMSEGNNGLDLDALMPFILMEDSSDSNYFLRMVLMSSMAGGMDTSEDFSNMFNLLVPLLLGSDDGDEGGDEDILFILLAMQSQAPGSSIRSSAILPMLMMSSDSNNQELIMFMAMMNNQNCLAP